MSPLGPPKAHTCMQHTCHLKLARPFLMIFSDFAYIFWRFFVEFLMIFWRFFHRFLNDFFEDVSMFFNGFLKIFHQLFNDCLKNFQWIFYRFVDDLSDSGCKVQFPKKLNFLLVFTSGDLFPRSLRDDVFKVKFPKKLNFRVNRAPVPGPRPAPPKGIIGPRPLWPQALVDRVLSVLKY